MSQSPQVNVQAASAVAHPGQIQPEARSEGAAVAISSRRHLSADRAQGSGLSLPVTQVDPVVIDIHSPYDGRLVGAVSGTTPAEVDTIIDAMCRTRTRLSRQRRHDILIRARELLSTSAEEFAELISAESGIALVTTRREVGRAADVLLFSAHAALSDTDAMPAADIGVQPRDRVILARQTPLPGIILAITPFNHPLNQVVHKVAPALAADNVVLLKPSEKTPLTALLFRNLMLDAGLPADHFHVICGDAQALTERALSRNEVTMVSFTGGTAVGRELIARAGYRRVLLELGGCDPMIVTRHADLELAADKAAEGAFGNSGQRCTAVKRLLVEQEVEQEFVDLLVAHARAMTVGDPSCPTTDIGTLITSEAAAQTDRWVQDAVRGGALLLSGGERVGAAGYAPTVLSRVEPDMDVVAQELFAPVAPVQSFAGRQAALAMANSTRYGLSAGVFTRDLEEATWFAERLECGSVNINEIPGYRTERSPFGGIKDSGLGLKEGVMEAFHNYTYTKVVTIPWSSLWASASPEQ